MYRCEKEGEDSYFFPTCKFEVLLFSLNGEQKKKKNLKQLHIEEVKNKNRHHTK